MQHALESIRLAWTVTAALITQVAGIGRPRHEALSGVA